MRNKKTHLLRCVLIFIAKTADAEIYAPPPLLPDTAAAISKINNSGTRMPAADEDVAASTTSGSMIGSPRPPACAAIAESASTADVVMRSLRNRISPADYSRKRYVTARMSQSTIKGAGRIRATLRHIHNGALPKRLPVQSFNSNRGGHINKAGTTRNCRRNQQNRNDDPTRLRASRSLNNVGLDNWLPWSDGLHRQCAHHKYSSRRFKTRQNCAVLVQ